MRIKLIQGIIDAIRGKKGDWAHTCKLKHKKYSQIYTPYYNTKFIISQEEHNIFNKSGQKLRTFFIRDKHLAHIPCIESKYFIWDRFNIGLTTHFYSHEAMLETMGNPDYKYGFLIESEAIVPDDYKIFEKYKGLNKDFDLIFTYNADILEKYDNARFVPFCCRVRNAENIKENQYLSKTKNISILSSNKLMCELHKFRYNLAIKCKKEDLADAYGTFDGGSMVKLTDTLNDYMYTICIENDIKPYFFTERITTALAACTIPIYCGASEIDKFFNPDGIIKLKPSDNIERIIKQCTKEEYERRLPAIIDNCNRVKKYYNPFDYMAENYLSDLCDITRV